MNPDKEKFINADRAVQLIQNLGQEFALIHNPDYVHPEYELYPLAPKITSPRDEISAVVMDMDGTTTTTEVLCIHSLEWMVRQITDRKDPKTWSGLNREKDYPYIIGNSTTKHVEYLINTYKNDIKDDALREAFIQSAVWFLFFGKDENRVREVRANLRNLGAGDLVDDTALKGLESLSNQDIETLQNYFTNKYASALDFSSNSHIVRAAVDIYYCRYHEILGAIDSGESEQFVKQFLSDPEQELIEPMPGVGVFLALIKGWLDEGAEWLFDELVETIPDNASYGEIQDQKDNFLRLCKIFQKKPLKVAVVTSSIEYEAKIVLKQVFRVLQKQIEKWEISKSLKEILLQQFSDYSNIYDGFVTASDSSEIRLKPHRDLYSIALHQLGIPKENFDQVIGFEDSESGTIAIRAAGIGLCCAVPFADTSGHDLSAAAFILDNGLPEAILKHNLFLKAR